MKDWKIIFKKILFPPGIVMLALTAVCTAALIKTFSGAYNDHPVAYFTYFLSAYTLTVGCIFLWKVLPHHYRRIKARVYNHPFGNRYMTDAAFKVKVSLYVSLVINLLYAALKMMAGIFYSSLWLGGLAVYYILLSLMRFVLLHYMRDDDSERGLLHEYHIYRVCGALMMILNLSLTGIVFQMVWQNKGYEYPGTLIFAVAAYTFYAVTTSVIDIIKYRKFRSPVLSACKAIRFAAALVSLLTMETAMLAQFGEDDGFRQLMTALTGGGVCIIVLAVSSHMIIMATKIINKGAEI